MNLTISLRCPYCAGIFNVEPPIGGQNLEKIILTCHDFWIVWLDEVVTATKEDFDMWFTVENDTLLHSVCAAC